MNPVSPTVRAKDAWSSVRSEGACSGPAKNVSLDIGSSPLNARPKFFRYASRRRRLVAPHHHVGVQRFQVLTP